MRWIGLWLMVCACSNRVVANDEGEGDGATSSADDGVDDRPGEDGVDDRPGDGSDPDAGELDDGVDVDSEGEGEGEVDEGMMREDQEALLAVATFLAPETPLQWHLVSDWEDGELVEVRLQSLSLDIGSATQPRQLVGEPFVVEGFVGDTGEIGIAIDELSVPGEANPITGSPIFGTDVRLVGMMLDGGSACGTVTGMIEMPLQTPLDGSTFAITPIESLDALPDVVVAGC
jgi:hypothetical protein